MTTLSYTRLRFDVERDPADGELVSLIKNPSGALGGWGWITPLTGAVMSGVGDHLEYKTAAGTNYFTSENLPVTPLDYIAATWVVSAALSHAVRFEFYDASELLISSSTVSPSMTTTGTVTYPPVQVPATSASARLRYNLATTSAGSTLGIHDVTVATASVSADLVATRTNLIPDPSYETTTPAMSFGPNSTGASTLTRVTGTGTSFGTYALRLLPKQNSSTDWCYVGRSTGSSFSPGQMIPIKPSTPYTYSIYFKAPRAVTAYVSITGRDGTSAASWASGSLTLVSVPANTWTRLSTVMTSSRTASYAELFAFVQGLVPGDACNFDAELLEEGTTLGAFITGTVATGDLPILPPAYFVDIIGPTCSFEIDRDELNVSTLTATIVSTSLDPATSDYLRPGRDCRLYLDMADAGATDPTWEPVFTGATTDVTVDYRLSESNAEKRAVISLTAADAVSRLAQYPAPQGVATIGELPFVLEGAGVPWSINGSGNQVPTATVVATNDQAYAIDQVAITRDTDGGFAWVDRRGVLCAIDPLDTTVAASYAETEYTADIGISFDASRAVNIVSVDAYEANPATGETTVVTHDPFRDEASIRTWGARQKTFTVQGLDDAQIATLATAILAANATPVRTVTYINLVVDEANRDRAMHDLYDLVEVVSARAGMSPLVRIVSITHSISASTKYGVKWLMKLSFATDGSVAPPQVIARPSTGAGLPANSPTNFVIPGTGIRVQTGTIGAAGPTATGWSRAVTFATPFSDVPKVTLTAANSSTGNLINWGHGTATASGFTAFAEWNDQASHTTSGSVDWIAIGPA